MNTIIELRAIRDELHDSVFETVRILKQAYAVRNQLGAGQVEDINSWYDDREMFIYNGMKDVNKHLDAIMDMEHEPNERVIEWRRSRDEGVEMNLKYMDAFREELYGATDSKTVDIYKVKARLGRNAETMLG